jgi:2-haloacid dehalogenase
MTAQVVIVPTGSSGISRLEILVAISLSTLSSAATRMLSARRAPLSRGSSLPREPTRTPAPKHRGILELVPDREVDAVVFDLGGVLIDWNPRHLYRQLFADDNEMEDFLANVCTMAWHRQHDLGADTQDSCRRLAERHPAYQDEIMAWAERGEEMIADQLDDAVAVLEEVKATGTRCYALSNMEAETFPIRHERFAFMNMFDGCVISGIEGVAKPDERIFQILLERYDLDPAAIVFADDTRRNVEAARVLGINAVHYTSAHQFRRELRALGVSGLTPA